MPYDIVFCLNRGLMRPLITAMNSIVSNTGAPEALRFNIAVPPTEGEADYFRRRIDAAFPDRVFDVRVAGVSLSGWLADYVSHRTSRPVDPNAGLTLNYGRFEIHNHFDDLGSYIYLDGDLIVIDDIRKAIDRFSPENRLAAAPQLFTGVLYFRNLLKGFGEGLKMLRPFNAGVYVTDAAVWHDDVSRELAAYLDWDRRHGYSLFWLHTEPLMNLIFKDYQHLPKRWNRSGYGNHPRVAGMLKRPLSDVSVIHWSGGHHKPWANRSIVFAEEWWKYDKGPIGP